MMQYSKMIRRRTVVLGVAPTVPTGGIGPVWPGILAKVPTGGTLAVLDG